MPIKRAAYKALRQDKKKHLRNLSAITHIKTLSRKLHEQLSSNNRSESEQALRNVISALDKAARKGIMRKGTASRKASRLSKLVFKSSKEKA